MHEVLHAYFKALNVNPLMEDHNEMGLLYVDEMAAGIREVYPSISADDAKALAWGGLHESYSWLNLVRTSPTGAQSIIDKNKAYKRGQSGTKCN
ncbi:hypothetical protein [Chitinophaga polysaccharea]|uniref:hypothetical protein n=1 Tax=Chitinophaga polysaccharea TaxID=1293035 RepID=UPI0011591F24|nr:hypothetical protein [Chitinophaga polysaccharea]